MTRDTREGVSSEFARSLFIENGFDASILRVSSPAIDCSWATRNKTPSDRVRFGYIGTLSETKGARILIEALRGIPLGDAADLAIYGAPAHHRQYFEGLQAVAGLDPRIQFRGTFPKEDMDRVFQGIDVLVVPSIWYENMPLVIHAALATGTAVIATDLGGLSSVVDEGVNGLLFARGSAGALRELMLACAVTQGYSPGCETERNPSRPSARPWTNCWTPTAVWSLSDSNDAKRYVSRRDCQRTLEQAGGGTAETGHAVGPFAEKSGGD